MHSYVVTALVDGKRKKKVIEAESELRARSSSGFLAKDIVSVRERSALERVLTIEPARPKLQIQALFLASFASAMLARREMKETLSSLLPNFPALRPFAEDALRAHSASDVLVALRFDPMIIARARVGEASGNVDGALMDMSADLSEILKMRREMGGGLGQGAFYGIMGLLLMIAMPMIYGEILDEIIRDPSMTVPMNIFSDIMLSLYHFYNGGWYYLIPLVLAGVIFRKAIWQRIRGIPPFSIFYNYARTRRSLLFMQDFVPLYMSGIKVSDGIELLMRGIEGETRAAYEALHKAVLRGKAFSEALAESPQFWCSELLMGVQGIESSPKDRQSQILGVLKKTLFLQLAARSGTVGKFLSGIGYFMVGFSFVLTLVGGSLPMQSIQAH